jgi:hypothetical protein
MKKLVLLVVAAVALATPALAADKRVLRAPPPPPPASPWDVAFGAGFTSDYIFRGITQSAHNPSANAYFEPRYNVNPYLQLYAGIAGASIAFPNRAAAEIDGFAGIRPTFGPLALDFGGIYYWYPGGTCFNGSTNPFFGQDCIENGFLPVNGNVIKRDLSFWEVYGTSARATISTPWLGSRTAFRTRATPPGTSVSASPRACSRSTSATSTPT